MANLKIPSIFQPLFKPSRYKAFHGGRGSAKSHSYGSATLVLGAERPLRILCGREVQLSIKDSVKQLLEDKIDALGLRGFYTSTQSEIRGANGTLFIFSGLGTMTAESLKSIEGIDIAWIEEAQTISSRSMEILIPTIRKPNSELWFSWNPRNPKDPVDQRFRCPQPPPDSIIVKANYYDNPFFPDVLEQERLYDLAHKPDRYAHIWLGEYEPTALGAIWDRVNFHENRRHEVPDLDRIVVGVDPAVSSNENSDTHGIVVAGMGTDQRGYVLADRSMKGGPRQWAQRAIAAFDEYEADAIVIEVNQGGDMVRHTLESVRAGLPIIEVRATRGKHVRAEPIAAMYSAGRISHVGVLSELEDQMCEMTAGGFEGDGSPDRVDAAVWALTELFPQMNRQKADLPTYNAPPLNISGGWMG